MSGTAIPDSLVRAVGYARPWRRTFAVCPHEVCRLWTAGPCTVNLAFLAPPEVGDDQR
jgi:hypothetical protein